MLIWIDVTYGQDFSLNYCANYLCSKYSREMTEYLSGGCEDSLDSLIKQSEMSVMGKFVDTNSISVSAAIILALVSFFGAMCVGIVVSKEYSF